MMKQEFNELSDVFKNSNNRAIAIIGDVDQAKSNTIYHAILALKKLTNAQIKSYGLHMDINGVYKIHSVSDLEKTRDSVIFMDEFADLVSINNARQKEKFEKTMRVIFQHNRNNIVILVGLPHNFNKFIAGLIDVFIFKQCTLEDFIQRSSPQQAIASFQAAGMHEVEKGSEVLLMPKNVAVIYNKRASNGEAWSEIKIPHEKNFDTKELFRKPVMTWNAETVPTVEESRMSQLLKGIQQP